MDEDQYMLFASGSFVLVYLDNYLVHWDENHNQQIGLWNRSTEEWHIPPPPGDVKIMDSEELKRLNWSIMSELRWE